MKDFYKIAGLFRKFRMHTIREEEVQELKAWLKDEKNRELFNRLLDGEQEAKVMRELRKYDTRRAFRQFTSRVHTRKRPIGFYLRAAAACAIPLVLGVSIYWWTTPRKVAEVPLTQFVTSTTPGMKKAVLTFENGMKMALGDAIEEEIVSAEGARLKVDSTGLIYPRGWLKIP